MIPLDVLTQPAPSFDDPLAMLQACHGKLRRFCHLLHALPAHLERHGADLHAAEAARDIMRYFEQAGPLHHQDEEEELFPLLRARDPAAAEALTRLSREHAELNAQWHRLRPALERVTAGETSALSTAAVAAFVNGYRRHTSFEEQWLLPLAQQLIQPQELLLAGARMAARRQDR